MRKSLRRIASLFLLTAIVAGSSGCWWRDDRDHRDDHHEDHHDEHRDDHR